MSNIISKFPTLQVFTVKQHIYFLFCTKSNLFTDKHAKEQFRAVLAHNDGENI